MMTMRIYHEVRWDASADHMRLIDQNGKCHAQIYAKPKLKEGRPVSSYVALAYFSGAAEPVSDTFASMEGAAAWVEKKLFVSESTPIPHPYQKPAPDFHD